MKHSEPVGEAAEANPVHRPVRVMQILSRLGAGGSPPHVLCLNGKMPLYGYEMLLVSGTCSPGEAEMCDPRNPGTAVIRVPEMRRGVSLRSDFVALWRLWRLMRRFRPDVVHTHAAKAGALGRIAAVLARVPARVHTFHGHVLTGYFGAVPSLAIRWIERLLACGTDEIVVLSEQQASDICERFRVAPRRKVRVIPLGLCPDPFVQLRPLSGKELTVGWLGRFVPVKDVRLLAEVVQRTISRVGSVRFVIGGDGPERSSIEALVDRFGPGRVEWLGWCENVADAIGRCDLLIQTSRNEGTPVSLMQGMAAGRPFVAAAVGGVVDLATGPCRRSGNAAWYDNCILVPRAPEVFAETLARLAADRSTLKRMGAAGQDFVLRVHSEEQMLARVAGMYSRVLAARRKCAMPAPERPWKPRYGFRGWF